MEDTPSPLAKQKAAKRGFCFARGSKTTACLAGVFVSKRSSLIWRVVLRIIGIVLVSMEDPSGGSTISSFPLRVVK